MAISPFLSADAVFTYIWRPPEGSPFPPIRVRYRPITYREEMELERIGKHDLLATDDMLLETIAKHVVEWDLKKPDGTVVDPRSKHELHKVAWNVLADIATAIRQNLCEELPPPEEEEKNSEKPSAS